MIDLLEYLRFALNPLKGDIATCKSDSIRSIDYSRLRKKGVDALVFDFDDTLERDGRALSEGTKAFLTSLKKKGFRVGVLSNCTKLRRRALEGFFSGTGICVGRTNTKPNPSGFLEILSAMKTHPKNAAMVGDKLGVDLWGAKRAGISERILVKKVSEAIR